MRKLSYFTTLVAMLLLAACGDSGQGFVGNGGGTGGSPGGAIVVSAVNVLASSPSLPSDAGQSLDVTVVVRDQNNVAVGGVTVVMSSDSGILTIADPITDANGVVKAQINAGGDPTNRIINISADANGVVGSVAINVLGTTLSLSGASALAQGDSAPYTIVLTDAGGNGISNQTVDISSSAGNTLAASSLTTDVGGQAQVVLTASAAGADTLTATALGLSATQDLVVSDDSFSITAPLNGDEVVLNTVIAVDLTWSIGGVPQTGQPISFSATRGTLSSFSATTNGAGVASVTISSNNAGASAITATNSSGTTTGVQIEFVADVPDSISIQASPFTIGPGEQSAITAIVRDVANNLVKNEVVVFVLDDVTGGQLSVAQAVTDSQGRAQTFYTASSTTSANNGVTVTASVQANSAISNSVNLTVAQRELFISIGTGNSIFEPNTAQYRVEFVVQVSDSQGNGVAGVNVQVGILSDAYFKGFWTYDQLAAAWVQILRAGPCADEDVNRNGVLDLGEDFNNSGRIEAGNIAAAVPQSGSNGSFVTDNGGFGIVDVFYAQDHARWVAVTIEATTSVQGTEFAKASSFILPINGEDVNDQNQVPPGVNSPFGVSTNCGDTL
jgi:Bacterial Ig-like domain (group 1)